MNFDELMRHWDFGNQMMPHQLTITHLPTGLKLTGNCKHEQSKLRLERDLTDALAILVAKAEAENPSLIRKTQAESENEQLRKQLVEMQANIQRLLNQEKDKRDHQFLVRPPKVEKAESKPKKGWSPEKRAAAAQRMKDRQAARYGIKPESKIDTPAGEKTEEQLIKEQMRTPNQAPVRMPKHASHGSTVVQVSPEAMAKGFKP